MERVGRNDDVSGERHDTIEEERVYVNVEKEEEKGRKRNTI